VIGEVRPGWVRAGDAMDSNWKWNVRPTCPECETWHNVMSKCRVLVAARQTRKEDWAWWKAHPDVTERVRPLTVEEQLVGFLDSGHLYDRMMLVRDDWFRSGGEQSCLMALYYPE
jgi:hypothetical protein